MTACPHLAPRINRSGIAWNAHVHGAASIHLARPDLRATAVRLRVADLTIWTIALIAGDAAPILRQAEKALRVADVPG